jgi:serine/threonine-protein kinase
VEAHKRIGDYEVLGEIGAGGMGRVFKVRNVISERIEAMKVLLPDLAERQDLAARFLREIKLVAALDHPHIAALHTALTADNQLAMIMEFVEGQSLAARLAQGPVATADAVTYIDHVLDALDYAHARQVVHRDVKPANMLLTPQGVVKLTDFGIARSASDQSLTLTGTTTGSLAYMSPEQIRGEPTDARSDVYSVGISLYELVTGVRPFDKASSFGLMAAQVSEPARPPIELQPSLPSGLNEVILKAIEKAPAARFASAAEFRRALASVSVPGRTTAGSRGEAVVPPAAVGAAAAVTAAAPSLSGSRARSAAASDHARAVSESRTPAHSPLAAAMPDASVPAAKTRSGHPLAYVVLGAVLLLVAMAGTGYYLRNAEAGEGRVAQTPPAAPPMTTPVTPPVASPATPQATESATPPVAAPAAPPVTGPATPSSAAVMTPAVAPPATTVAKPSKPAGPPAVAPPPPSVGSPTPAHSQAPAQPPASEPARDSAADRAALDRLESEMDQLDARAAAVNDSLDRMRQEQARMGVGLRGDMAARQQSMNTNLKRAEDAINARDAARAQRSRDAAERDIEALEKFLGR